MIKLFISVYDRPEYLQTSLDSLLESFSAIYPEIIITDDGSTDPSVALVLSQFKLAYQGECSIVTQENKGIPLGKLDTIYTEVKTWLYIEEYFIISDSDMIYKKGWLEELVYLYEQTKTPLVTGFNTETNRHETTSTTGHYAVKSSVGGCNILVNTKFYLQRPFRESKEWDFRMCERAHEQHPLGVISAKPSVVDHIGIKGKWARENYHDKAIDFKENI